MPTPWMSIPFVALLLAIAVMPLWKKVWWERWYPAVSLVAGAVTASYYVFSLNNSVRLGHAGMEYLGFIALIGSLFVVSGGIHIEIGGEATPVRNTVLLAIGALASNLIGTTGASMILIRPYLRSNRGRIAPYHVVFFIFLVSNIGGALTPTGDPPLFLGYLKGVPYFWVAEHLWLPWLIGVVFVLGVFYVLEFNRTRKMGTQDRRIVAEKIGVSGWHNLVFLLVILGAVFIADPPFVREGLMIAAALGSYFTTRRDIHERNDFSFGPLREVAILFIGIFLAMVPALDWLEMNAGALGLRSPGAFFWCSGMFSSVLDNAPTYLSFLSALFGVFLDKETLQYVQNMIVTHGALPVYKLGPNAADVVRTYFTLANNHPDKLAYGAAQYNDIATSFILANRFVHLKAISLGSVFFGAMTYIGNGPNFMVRSIAETAGVKMPHFFEYIVRYSIPVLIPLFVVLWWMFFV